MHLDGAQFNLGAIFGHDAGREVLRNRSVVGRNTQGLQAESQLAVDVVAIRHIRDIDGLLIETRSNLAIQLVTQVVDEDVGVNQRGLLLVQAVTKSTEVVTTSGQKGRQSHLEGLVTSDQLVVNPDLVDVVTQSLVTSTVVSVGRHFTGKGVTNVRAQSQLQVGARRNLTISGGLPLLFQRFTELLAGDLYDVDVVSKRVHGYSISNGDFTRLQVFVQTQATGEFVTEGAGGQHTDVSTQTSRVVIAGPQPRIGHQVTHGGFAITLVESTLIGGLRIVTGGDVVFELTDHHRAFFFSHSSGVINNLLNLGQHRAGSDLVLTRSIAGRQVLVLDVNDLALSIEAEVNTSQVAAVFTGLHNRAGLALLAWNWSIHVVQLVSVTGKDHVSFRVGVVDDAVVVNIVGVDTLVVRSHDDVCLAVRRIPIGQLLNVGVDRFHRVFELDGLNAGRVHQGNSLLGHTAHDGHGVTGLGFVDLIRIGQRLAGFLHDHISRRMIEIRAREDTVY